MHFSLDGLVVKEMPWAENDKRIVLLTADRGRMSVLAKGARSVRSKYVNTTGLFTYGNFEVVERGETKWLGGASIIDAFWGIRRDIDNLSLAAYIVDLAGEITGEEAPAGEILRLTLNTLYAISEHFKSREQIKTTYEIRALAMAGYLPNLSGCAVCGAEQAECMYVDVMNGMLKCPECLNRAEARPITAEDDPRTNQILIPLSAKALTAARYIIGCPVEKVLSVTLEDEILGELSRFGESYAIHHLERRLPTLDFYYEVTQGTVIG